MKLIHAGIMSCLLLPMMSLAAEPEPPVSLDQKNGLVFRWTGPEAARLRDFLKTRTPAEKDTRVVYYGDKQYLACSVQDDCFLYLSKKEWGSTQGRREDALTLDFTLPVNQSVLQGQLMLSPFVPAASHGLQLRFTDDSTGETFAFREALSCPLQTEWTGDYLKGDGDCRLEFAAEKKYLSYQPSAQFVGNSESVFTVLSGPLAEKLMGMGSFFEVDPDEPNRARVTLGPQFYCWDLDRSGTELPRDERFICHIKHFSNPTTDVPFFAAGASQNGEGFALVMRPRFDRGLLDGFSLSYKTGQTETLVEDCPYDRNKDEPGHCSFALNYRRDAIYYPAFIPVQGVAVGWGVMHETAPVE